MTIMQIADAALAALKAGGADHAQVTVTQKETREFNVDGGKFSLFRTLFDNSLSLTALVGGKKGSLTLNRTDDEAIAQAAKDCLAVAASGESDPAWEFAPVIGNRHFEDGVPVADTDKLFDRAEELMKTIAERHPKILMEQMIVTHSKRERVYKNTNGVCFTQTAGEYGVELMFSAHEGEKSSSFFGSGVETTSLDRPFIELGSIEDDLEKTERQIDTETIEGKFVGTVLLPPGSLGAFIYFTLSNFAGDGTILDGTSLWKDKLGTKVADERITISAAPLDERVVCGERFTGEGYPSANYDVIKDGVLDSFMLSQYVANKTGNKRAANSSGCIIMKNGEKPLDEIIKGIERGIWVGRFSGGHPGTNGDFSGVAKNSFLIENGKITKALAETMISGNLAELLNNLIDISAEVVCDGSDVLPYAAFGGVTISGK